MNSHFQSSETTCTVTGVALELIGLRGARSWAPTHATPPTSRTVMAGGNQKQQSKTPEKSQTRQNTVPQFYPRRPKGNRHRAGEVGNTDPSLNRAALDT